MVRLKSQKTQNSDWWVAGRSLHNDALAVGSCGWHWLASRSDTPLRASFAPPRIQDDVPELWTLVLGLELLVVLVVLMTAVQHRLPSWPSRQFSWSIGRLGKMQRSVMAGEAGQDDAVREFHEH
jgi:hypothetical protein